MLTHDRRPSNLCEQWGARPLTRNEQGFSRSHHDPFPPPPVIFRESRISCPVRPMRDSGSESNLFCREPSAPAQVFRRKKNLRIKVYIYIYIHEWPVGGKCSVFV